MRMRQGPWAEKTEDGPLPLEGDREWGEKGGIEGLKSKRRTGISFSEMQRRAGAKTADVKEVIARWKQL